MYINTKMEGSCIELLRRGQIIFFCSNNPEAETFKYLVYYKLVSRMTFRRAMRIICPGIEYQQALALMSLPTVAEHYHNICTRTFESIMSDPNHKLRKLLPPLYKSNYNLRHARTFTLPRCKTHRFKNSFFMASGRIVNNF